MNAIIELINRLLAIADAVKKRYNERKREKEMADMGDDPTDYFLEHHSVQHSRDKTDSQADASTPRKDE